MPSRPHKSVKAWVALLTVCGGACQLAAQDLSPQNLAFEPNQGQFAPAVSFAARGSSYAISLAGTEATLRLRGRGEEGKGSASMKFVGGNPNSQSRALDPQPGRSNYLIGNDPSKWQTGVPHFSRVRYSDVYPGIDLIYYGNQRQLEYDLVVAPHADPGRIGIEFEDVNRIDIAPNGDLKLQLAESELRLLKPDVYQQIDGVRRQIAGRYVLYSGNRVGFRIASYDHRVPLIIDPVLSYATYLGGSANEVAYAVATDTSGNAYVAGYTSSTDFPKSTGAYEIASQGGVSDAFVAKYSPTGTLIYATYLGGSGQDTAYGIAVDASFNAYITGFTASTNFPTTNGAYSTSLTGTTTNAFVTKINPSGTGLLYSTYLGGSGTDIGYGIALDTANEATITGSTSSSNFPTTSGVFSRTYGGGASNAFVTRVSAAGTALVYSTYIGGSGDDVGNGIALDSSGNAYITGYTNSANFPHTAGVAQTAIGGDYDAFVTAINPTGTAPLLYSTFLGGSAQDYGVGIAVDAGKNAYIVGSTVSANYPFTSGVLQAASGGESDAFVTKLTSAGALVYSTFVGGSADDYGLAIAVDPSGNAYIAGDTASTNFPTTFDALQSTTTGEFNLFVAQINPTATALGYSTYLGGSGFESAYGIALDSSATADSLGRLPAWLAGYTNSSDFPVTGTPAQATLAGGTDALVMKVVGCIYSLASSSASQLAAAAGAGTVGLTASLSGCPWTASSNAAWLTITSPAAGTGSTTIAYSIAQNTNTVRLGTLTIAGMTFTVNQNGLLAQTITFGPISAVTYGVAPFSLTATAAPSGLTVSFASTTLPVCTVSGNTVTIVAAGTCSITASQAGNTSYAPATPVVQSFTVNQASQTITFGPLSNVTYGVAPFTITATTTASGLAVSFASNTPAVCTISGNTVTIGDSGTCSITASQAGNANYAAASSVTQTFTVKATQAITFGQIGNVRLSVGTVTVTPAPTASSNLAVVLTSNTSSVCTVAGVTITILTTGTCTIAANQAGNATFAAAPPVTQSFTVNPTNSTVQTITFGTINAVSFGAVPFTITATVNSPLAVSLASNTTAVCTISGFTVTLVAVGTCSITATQAGTTTGNPIYGAATPVTQTFAVNQGSQTISFAAPAAVTLPASSFTLIATASSGLQVSFASTTTGICTVSGSTLTPVTAGTCSITATQVGNTNYVAATPVIQSFTINAASNGGGGGGGGGASGPPPNPLTLTPSSLTFNSALAGAAASQTISVANSTGQVSYSAIVSYSGPVRGWLSVSPASGTTGSQSTMTVTVNPAGLSAGTYTGAINVSTATSFIAATVTLTVQAVQAKMTVAPSSLNFAYQLGASSLPPVQSVSVFSNPSGVSFTAAASSNGNWLSASPGTASSASGSTTPGSVAISVDVSKLGVGTSTGKVTISSANAPSIDVPVTIAVTAATPASLSVSPATESLTLAQGSSPASGQATVSNTGGGTLQFTAQASADQGSWLTLNGSGSGLATASGSATASAPASLSFTADPTGLSPGLYTGHITVSDANSGSQATVSVLLTVTSAGPLIQLSQTGVTMTALPGGAQPPAQSFTVGNSGGGSLSWTAQTSTLSGGNWLQATPASGTSASGQTGTSVSISANTAGLAVGQYYGSVDIVAANASNSPQTVSVALNVVSSQASPGVTVSAGGAILVGAAGGTTPVQQAVIMFNPSSAAVSYSSSASTANGTAWLSVTPPSGTASPGTNSIQITADLSGLSPGVQTGTVQLAFGDGSAATIQVVALATGSAAHAVSGLTAKAGPFRPLALTACPGGKPSFLIPILQLPVAQSVAQVAAPETVQAQVIDDCGNPVTAKAGGSVQVTFSGAGSSNDAGLNLHDVGSGIWKATWTPVNAAKQVVVQLAAAEAGITVNPSLNVDASVTATVQAATAISAALPTIVANAASGGQATPQVVAPGSYVAIYGTGLAGTGNPSATSLPLPTTLNGTQLFLGGKAMPLLYASSGQVNALVPQGLAPNASYPLVAVVNGTTESVPVALTVVELQPGIYTWDESGSGPGIVTDAVTYQPIIASNPAHAGEYLTIYCTGLGAVSGPNGEPGPADGAATPTNPVYQTTANVTATIGGVSAPVLFSGLTPVDAALYQVNVQVPPGVTPGNAVRVVITATDPQTGVTAQSNPITIVAQ